MAKSAEQKENAVEGEFEAPADGKTRIGDTEVSIKEIASIKDGEMMLQLEDGSTVKASDVEFGSSDEALLYENVLDMGLNAASANAFLRGYEGKQSAEIYALGFREAYQYGEYGVPESELSQEGFLPDLTEVQRHLAYNLGKANAEAKAERENKGLKDAIKKAAERAEAEGTKATADKKGGVRFEAGARPKTAAQKHTARLAKHLAKALGIDIVFYDATLDGAKNTKDNGYYDPNDDSIHLDLQNAKVDAKTIVFTLSHELVHFIKKWSPAKFKIFADFLMEQYAAHGVSASELLQNKMAALGTTDADLAYEEMIADACERMLLDSDAVVKLMDLRKADLNLFEKIKLHVLEILEKLRAVFNGVGPNTAEGVALQNMVDVLDKLHAMFEDAAVDAVKTYQVAQESGSEGLAIKRQAKPSKKDPDTLDPRTITELDVYEMLERVSYGEYDDGKYIPLRRNTPEFFINVVREHSKGARFIEDYPMAATAEHLRQNMEEIDGQSYGQARPHELSIDDIITAIRKMGDPSYIVLQKNNRYAEVVSFYNKRNKHVVISIDFAYGETDPKKQHNYKHAQEMVGYEGGYYNIVATQYEPDDFRKYLNDNEVVYDKKEMNGKYQVGSGRIVAVSHDTPFIEDIVPQDPDSVKRENVDGEKSQKKTVSDRTFSDALESVVQETGNEKLAIKRQVKQTRDAVADPFSYEALTSKPDMKITTVAGVAPTNRADVVFEAKKNAAAVGKTNKNGSVSVYVDDIGADVVLGTDGLKHGLRRNNNSQDKPNYVVTMKAGEIIKNSVLINELTPEKADATYGYILIGAAREANGALYIVRSVVNRFNSELESMDVLYAINAKKESAVLNAPRFTGNPLSVTDSIISIAQLLDLVNRYFPDVLPESVLKHYGHTSRPSGELGKSVLHQKKTVTNRTLLADALESTVKDETERKRLTEYKEAITEIEAAQERLTEIRAKIKELSFAKGPRDTKAINELRFEANKLANRISVLDGKLLRLESMGAIKGVLEREKARAYEKAKQEGKEALAAYRERAEMKQ